MSLTKKDPSLRVAANDPHLVSLGGGRLSTAVTIHYIPVGDTTIGSSTTCSISLNGTGVRPTHCTIYRSEQNEVTIVPEHEARILIDGSKIIQETNLTQGAMITIGNSNYLRFNNPAEAQMMRSAMGSNERISMPQIDFTQPNPNANPQQRNSSKSNGFEIDDAEKLEMESFYESKINPINPAGVSSFSNKSGYDNVPGPIDINGLHCPKVFTADLVTVNMPAKDVLGQKYANFAKNLAENSRSSEKNLTNALRNNQMSMSSRSTTHQNGGGNIAPGTTTTTTTAAAASSITTNFIRNDNSDYPSKQNNSSTPIRNGGSHQNVTPYDRYPKPGTYGGLQIFPMNGLNTEINNVANASRSSLSSSPSHNQRNNHLSNNISSLENESLEDMLKKCTEYADRHQHNQSNNSSITSSPIVQNRIKTNGSLPREKKSPFYHDLSGAQLQQSFTSNCNTSNTAISTSSGYENVRLNSQNRIEINGQSISGGSGGGVGQSVNQIGSPKAGYENIVIGKYVPQSPRTKIRTTCMSPKKDNGYSNSIFSATTSQQAQPPPIKYPKPNKHNEYEQLIKTFEEKLKMEMQAIEESSRYQPNDAKTTTTAESTPVKRTNININNLKLNLQQPSSLQNSPRPSKKPAPAPRNLSKSSSNSTSSLPSVPSGETDVDVLKNTRKELLTCIQRLENDISELQKQEDEVLRELDLEKALVSAEVNSVGDSLGELENHLKALQHRIHRLEAQRNATRVMEENQQAKLKQSIEMKQDQIRKLKDLLKQKPNNDCLKEELQNVIDTLENDRKTFEDLEFQYLEEESEWHAYREELNSEEKSLKQKLQEKCMELQHLEKQEKLSNQNFANSDAKTLTSELTTLINELGTCQQRVKSIESNICDITGQLRISSSDEDEHTSPLLLPLPLHSNLVNGLMSQSLFGSAELLCPKRNHNNNNNNDIMSKSVNENMFYNNKIELPTTIQAQAQATSTPKRKQLQLVDIGETDSQSPKSGNENDDPLLRLKYNFDTKSGADGDRVKFNLSLGSDDFEVNPLEKRVPSQDDIDRICKVTTDAPISTKGATTKIFDSIKEIERNRQLLLAQQGHHVIEHERQRMNNLKKKSHDEARAQYLSMLNSNAGSGDSSKINSSAKKETQLHELQKLDEETVDRQTGNKENQQSPSDTSKAAAANEDSPSQQRHSQPEFPTHKQHQKQLKPQHHLSPRPLSEANSELSCELLDASADENACQSSIELSTTNTSGFGSGNGQRYSADANDEDAATKRSSVNSNDTTSGNSNSGHSSERKRALPKHQRPLTRYLPIFSPDLNLRHHIESAGHQITLCPHVLVDAYSCRGYLHKLGATFHGWARRWFVLDRQRSAFMYFSDKSERKPRGGAYFSTIDEVYLDHLNASKSGRPHCTFIVKTKKRSYHLQAASDAAARIWIDAIITGAQGNLDY